VIPGDCSVVFDNKKGGIEYFNLKFQQAGENRFPSAQKDTKAGVLTAADASHKAIADWFGSQFSTKGLPGFVADSSQTVGTDSANNLSTFASRYPSAPDKQATLSASINQFRTQVSSLVQTPLIMAQQFLGLTTTLQGVVTLPANLFQGFASLLTFGNGYLPIPLTTSTRRQQAINQAEQVALVRRAAVVGMAVAASTQDYASYNDAVTTRDQVASALDDEILIVGATNNDPLLLALGMLYTQSVQDITTRAASLTPLKTVTLGRTVPDLVLAYNLYGDASRASEISARNRVRHPLFVPGGKPLEVLAV
jgi:prophage DNA circulation protein